MGNHLGLAAGCFSLVVGGVQKRCIAVGGSGMLDGGLDGGGGLITVDEYL